MAQTGTYHGGLVFVGRPDQALEQARRIVEATLEDYGHPIEKRSTQNQDEARVVCTQYMVDISFGGLRGSGHRGREIRLDRVVGLNAQRRRKMDQDAHRLQLTLTAAAPGHDDCEVSELMLVVMLYRLVDAFAVTQIEWLSPDTILTVDQFLGAFTNVSPQRVRPMTRPITASGNRAFAPVEAEMDGLADQCDIYLNDPLLGDPLEAAHHTRLSEEEALSMAYRDSGAEEDAREVEGDSDVRRLASWGMTGMMVFLSAPVAASMAAVNLARGEDFRLNTHVLALTGFLAVMHSSGALQSAVALLPV